MRYLFLVLVLYSCSPKSILIAQDKCDVLSAIFDEKHISEYIGGFENNRLIRVIDLSDYFGKMKCGHEKYSVRVEDKLMVDLNSGRFIDLCILSVQEEKELTKFEVFYSRRTSECQRDFLMKGFLIFDNTSNGLRFKDSKLGSIN